ncbi:MAG: hypothetical protein JO368_08065, partial [Acidimicrobiales bacterium]|nr:hypothetical protein [Acidimicrobiales bacterium]
MAGTSVKTGLRRLFRPVSRRFYSRMDGRVDVKLEPLAEYRRELDDRVTALALDIEALSRYLPTVINTIATQNATNRGIERRISSAEDRVGVAEDRLA